MTHIDFLTLEIGSLRYRIDARDSGINLAVPQIFKPFLAKEPPLDPLSPSKAGDLRLVLIDDPQIFERVRGVPLCRSEVWELWRDDRGYDIFFSPRQTPPRRVTIDPSYQSGTIAFDFSALNGSDIYPLASTDIRITVNWLARFGDLILHAASIVVGAEGYCFLGESGAGKSTLAAALATEMGVPILGEDQAILRNLDGEFWIFGTPWHERADRCLPQGVPLKKVFFVDRNLAPGIHPITPSEGVQRVLQTAFIPYYLPEKLPLILERLSLLASTVPFFTINPVLGSGLSSQIFNQQI
ncbi:MAG TPA: hypothetical protein PK057_05920 [Brevefilum fermentans]|jgi:hypothetical protein|nr:hypothetical protein [Brevefilum fermentans]